MSRRAQIRLSGEEVLALLAEGRTVSCATIGRDGFPHLTALWYVVRDGQLWAWTFAKSQKVRNLERDPRATLLVEAGRRYDELRGVMLKTDVAVHRETEVVAALGLEILARYTAGEDGEVGDEVRAMVRRQAPKRVALQFAERSRATWDHRKLAAGVW